MVCLCRYIVWSKVVRIDEEIRQKRLMGTRLPFIGSLSAHTGFGQALPLSGANRVTRFGGTLEDEKKASIKVKTLSRLSPKKIELYPAVSLMSQGVGGFDRTQNNSVITNIVTVSLSPTQSKTPLNGARSFCNSQGGK